MEHSVEILWTDLKDELHLFILSKIKNKSDAEDILQEVFIKIHQNIAKLKNPAKLTSWVFQITRNTIIDHFRKAKDIVNIEEFDKAEDEDEAYVKLSNCINQKIHQLSEEYKDAIILTYLKNISQKQLADYLQLSYSGAKSRVQKARAILKKDIIDCPNL